MRLLFFGDLALTGFGTVTADLGRALLDKGIDVRFISSNEIPNLPEPFASRTLDITTYLIVHAGELTSDGIRAGAHGGIEPSTAWLGALTGEVPTLPIINGNTWGEWKPDAAFLVGDFYGVRLMTAPLMDVFAKLPSLHYVPIEGHDLPPLWADMWRVIKPIAMSKFGQQEIAKVTGEIPPLMYHGVDTEAFYPVSATRPISLHTKPPVTLASKDRCKAFFAAWLRTTGHPGIPADARIILRCDTNMPRKGHPLMLRILEPVMAARPDVWLFLKTTNFGQGTFLADVISKLNPAVGQRIVILEMQNLPREGLNALYNAADLYVSNSAEGFGLTLAEAEACGVPTVGIDYSSVPEVIGPAGKTVPVGNVWDNPYGHFWAFPDPDQFARTVAYLLDHPARARELGNAGPAHVRKTFDWGDAADVLIGVLNQRVKADTREMVAA